MKTLGTLILLVLGASFGLSLGGSVARSETALTPGQKAPEFSAKNQDGKVIKLSQFLGKPVVLYFYPKDDTPGCTKEACEFRDHYSKFVEMGAVVLGVSRQDEKSHQEFRASHKIPFDLLVDADGAIAKSYGIGTIPILGMIKRKSYLIGPDGKIAKYYDSVDPDTHTAQVLKDLQTLKN